MNKKEKELLSKCNHRNEYVILKTELMFELNELVHCQCSRTIKTGDIDSAFIKNCYNCMH